VKKGISAQEKLSGNKIDNKRLIKKIGELPADLRKKVNENIKIVVDLE
jgi:hypothetical protein